jgi:hypothetical protein
MPRTSTIHAVTVIGIEMGKSTLHMVGLNSSGAIVFREKVSRGRIASRFANLLALLASKREWRRIMLLVSLSHSVTM